MTKEENSPKKEITPGISIIIPTYKPGSYFKECLASIANQCINKDILEIIIILNGPQEPWRDTINLWINECGLTSISKFLLTNESGVSNARNIGIDNANGEYITFIDDDDYISPQYLEELLKVSSPNCVGLSDSIYYIESSGNLDYHNTHHANFLKLQKCQEPSIFKARRFFNGPVMKLIHRDIINSYRFDKRFANGEDSLFMALISYRIKHCRFSSPDAVYYRRVRSNSATTSRRPMKSKIYNSTMRIFQYIKYWAVHPLRYNIPFMTSRILASIKILVVND